MIARILLSALLVAILSPVVVAWLVLWTGVFIVCAARGGRIET